MSGRAAMSGISSNRAFGLLRIEALALLLALAAILPAPARAEEPLVLETKIPLGDVSGRIDHMAADPERQRVFVAELGNDSVGIVDLRQRKVVRRLARLKEPQGVGYIAATGTLFVANAGDGTVRLFQGAEFKPAETIALGKDADNIRIDAKAGLVFVGYGSGGIAAIDAATRQKRGDIALREHPEAFQLSPDGQRIYANVPDARQIAVIDRAAGKQVATWPTRDAHANFPMALEGDERVLSVFRRPPRLEAYATKDGSVVANLEVCGDADDIFVDERRHRVYISCGEGNIDVLERRGDGYERIARVLTSAGARTSFFLPELDRLVLGVRAVGGEPASLWVFRPSP
jgi:DNA-binding beta-propeller fold protein YncE